jgi:hypothetical protein
MNKKRFLVFSSLVLCIAAVIAIFLIFINKPEPAVSFLTAGNESEVGQFYYRAVPGLKMAESAGLVRSVDSRMQLSGRDAALNIDRIWYSNKNVVLFYHVEGISREAYLGGDIYLPSSEPVEKVSFHGPASIGGPDEKGILFRDSFYSCLKLPLLRDNAGKSLAEIEELAYTPFLTIPGQTENTSSETIQLKSFRIPLNYRSEDETVVKIPTDSQLDLDPERIHFYQVDMSPSAVRIYFQFLNSGRDRVNRIEGSYSTDKGESYDFDAYTTVITDFPYHYSIEVPPFDIPPESLQLKLDSVHLTGGEHIAFDLDTAAYTGKNHVYDTAIGKDRIKGTDISIRQIALDPHAAEVFIAYGQEEEPAKPYKKLELLAPAWFSGMEDPAVKSANLLIVKNEDFQPYDLDHWAYGAECRPGEGLRIQMSRDFWNASDQIHMEMKNLSYVYKIERDITIKLKK